MTNKENIDKIGQIDGVIEKALWAAYCDGKAGISFHCDYYEVKQKLDKLGAVMLDENQNMPPSIYPSEITVIEGKDLIKEGWRKVVSIVTGTPLGNK
jgi:hypothetical protein